MNFDSARFRWLPAAMMAAWLIVGTAFWILRGPSSREALWVGAVASLALAPAIWWLSGRVPLGVRPRVAFVAMHAAGALVFGNVMIAATYLAEAKATGVSLADAARAAPFLGAEFLFWMWLYGLLGAGSYGSRLQSALRTERQLTSEAAAHAAEARLEALRGQLNPHFLFNALHGVAALVRHDSRRAETALERLGGLLRFSLDEALDREVRVREELRFTNAYLDLERLGLGERLRVVVDVDESVLDAAIPPFALQTLAENAVRHGVAAHPQGGLVRIGVHARPAQVAITVHNSTPVSAVPSNGAGGGLANLRDRIAALYGDSAHLRAESLPEGGFVAELIVPRS